MEFPKWAREFVQDVYAKETGRPLPVRLTMHKSRRRFTLGYGGQARYIAGKFYEIRIEKAVDRPKALSWSANPDDELRYVLLHELAHVMLPTDVNHTKRMFVQAFKLYRKYLPPEVAAKAIKSDIRYMPRGATAAAKHLKIEVY